MNFRVFKNYTHTYTDTPSEEKRDFACGFLIFILFGAEFSVVALFLKIYIGLHFFLLISTVLERERKRQQ